MSDGDHISPWFPEQDQIVLAVLGKLIEECNELSARAARCIIHGSDETDPDTGLSNLTELEKECADVMACIGMAKAKLGVLPSLRRIDKKSAGYQHWHKLIEAGKAMIERPVIPTVLLVVNRNSQVEIFQDEGVQVAFADERVDTIAVTLLPRKNQAQELYDRLDGKAIVSPAEDHAETAANAVRQLKSLNITTTGLKPAKEAS